MTLFDIWHAPRFLTAKPNPEACEDFKAALLKRHGNYLKAWRHFLDKDNSNSCTWHEFQDASRELHFKGDVPGAWLTLDEDLSGSITLKEIDPGACGLLMEFKSWCDSDFGSVRGAFKILDDDGSGTISKIEFRRACRLY